MGDIEKRKLGRLLELVEEVLSASSKEVAKIPMKKLEFEASMLMSTLSPYAIEKLGQVISYSRAASGQVGDRCHWEQELKQAWYLFERAVVRDSP